MLFKSKIIEIEKNNNIKKIIEKINKKIFFVTNCKNFSKKFIANYIYIYIYLN